MKVNYKFPEKWCIQVTEENQQVLSNWRFTDGQKVSLGVYVGISKYGGRAGHTYSKEITWPDYSEISFEDFKKYVLDKYKEPEDPTPENYDYLIPLLKNII